MKMKKLTVLVVMGLVLVSVLSSKVFAASKVNEGSFVTLRYYFEADGKPVVSEKNDEEMKLIVGKGAYPPVFEKQLVGMKKGDQKTITLSPEKAFGPYRPELLRRVDKTTLPASFQNVREGALIGGKNGQRAMRVAKILDDSLVLDENHPLAGKTIVYHVRVMEVK